MKFILKLLVFLLFIGIGIVITGLLLPEKFKSVKMTQIKASPVIVFEQINNLRKWNNWHPWFKNDSLLIVDFQKPNEGKGAEMNLSGTAIGNCSVSLTHSVFPESLAIFYNFNTTESKTIALIFLEPSEGGTRINYTFNITNAGLWERFLILFYKKKIDNMVAESVTGLKILCEELKYSRIGEVSVEPIESKPAVIKLDSTHKLSVHSKIEQGFQYLDRFFNRRGITPLEQPFVLHYGMLNDTLEKIAVGRVIPERTWVWRTLQYFEIPEGKSVVVSYFGGRNTEKAHKAVQEYIREKGLKQNGVPREIALYNPETEPDSSLWETKVYYPVE